MDPRIVRYISRGRGAGVADLELRNRLVAAGWPNEVIDQALAEAGSHLKIVVTDTPDFDSAPMFVPSSVHQVGFSMVIGLLCLVVVSSIATLGYLKYRDSQNPDEVLATMSESIRAVTSFSYTVEAEIGARPYMINSDASTSLVALPTNVINQVGTTTVLGRGQVLVPMTGRPRLTFAATSESIDHSTSTFHLAIEGRLIDETLYVNIAKVSQLPLLDLSKLFGRWISINDADVIEVGLPYPVPSLSAGESVALRQALSQTKIITLLDRIGTEKINGVKTKQYTYTINQEAVAGLLDEYFNLTLPVKFVGGDIWLGAADGLPYQITLVSLDQLINIKISLADYNKPITIVAPKGAASLRSIAAPEETP